MSGENAIDIEVQYEEGSGGRRGPDLTPKDAGNDPKVLELPAPVLLLAPEPFFQARGTPIAVGHVLRALSENGRDAHLVTFEIGEGLELPGLRIFRARNPFRFADVPIGFSLRKVFLDVFLIWEARRRLHETTYCCIHAVEETVFPALFLGKRFGIPVLFDMQSDMPHQMKENPFFRNKLIHRVLRSIERWAFRRADTVVCSAGLDSQVRASWPAANVEEWRYPGQTFDASEHEIAALRNSLELRPSAQVVLYTGSFALYQGLSTLVRAARTVLAGRPDAVFVLVGWNRKSVLPEGSRALEEQGALKIVERQPLHMMPAFLGLADVVVSPRTSSHHLPLKVFDYMMAGKPIVATDFPFHRAILSEERAVLVEFSETALANGILDLLNDRQKAKALGEAASAYARKELSWLSFSQFVARLHQDLVFKTD